MRPFALASLAGWLALAGVAPAQTPDAAAAAPSTNDATPSYFPEEDTKEILQKANDEMTAGKVDEAMTDMDAAIYLQPKNAELRVFRALIYARKKLWMRAEADCEVALKIDPDSAIIKYNMAELKFMEKSYEDARPRFLQLQGDRSLGDLSAYKAFLCDLLSGNKDRAKQQLDVFNQVRGKPSYFFANAAWEMIGRHRDQAAKWFEAVGHAYDAKTIDPYFTALLEADSLDAPKVTFTTNDGSVHTAVPTFTEDAGLRVFDAQGWKTIRYQDVTEDLSGFPADMQRVILEKKQTLASPLADMHQVSFTTRDGRVFDHVDALIEGADLRVKGVLGWETIPFAQLPADLSCFPDYWQKEIVANDQALAPLASGTNSISFTTRSGKKYDQVRVFTGRTGLSVVTASGWETIPFAQLPDDLSAFPADLRQEIVEWEKAANARSSVSSAPADIPPPDGVKIPPVWNAAPGSPPAFIGQAQDCRFGRCLALQGSRLVVGCDGAAYVYENSELKARLCPDADKTGTGDRVRSVAISGDTIVTSTPKGVYVWIGTAQGWKLQQKIGIASPATVAVDGDNLAVGTEGKGDLNEPVRFYLRQDGGWQPAKAVGNESAASRSLDQSGRRIALQGTEAVIGLPNWDPGSRDNVGPSYLGHAWVKHWDGGAWQPETPLRPPDDVLAANQFGANVAFSGAFIAIGSWNRDNNPQPQPGAVYLFRRGSGGWRADAVLTVPDGAKRGAFGAGALALSGKTVAVAETDADTNAADVRLTSGEDTQKPGTIRNAGIVYVFEDGKVQASLAAPDPVDNLQRSGSPDHFAASLALDGDTLAVGAPGREDGEGAVYLWRREGGQWRPAGELKGFHGDYGLMP
jgi:tetratricopeptide (TPR) repeat protein